eukprot:12006325-Prorocentrum_lima.AAC.1
MRLRSSRCACSWRSGVQPVTVEITRPTNGHHGRHDGAVAGYGAAGPVSYTHLRAHETRRHL